MATLLYRRRRLLLLSVLVLIAMGLAAWQVLPRQEDPTLTPRFGLVITRAPGATAERVESLITEKIERELQEVEEISLIASSSRAGVSAISLEIADHVMDVDGVWSRVRDHLGDVTPTLPPGTGNPVLLDREADTFTWIVALVWKGEGEPAPAVLARFAEVIKDVFRSVPGTAYVKAFGAPDEEVRVELRGDTVASLGIGPADLAARIAASDAKGPAGLLRSDALDVNVEVGGEVDSLERLRGISLGRRPDGSLLRVRDVATVSKDAREPWREHASFDGRPGIAVAAHMLTTERIDLWSAKVERALGELENTLPDTVALETIFQQNSYVSSRLKTLLGNVFLGVGLVALCVFLIMGWQLAIVVSLALPLSALFVLTGLDFLDVPIQQMSITGLIIALGLLIDNAIIMVDEVAHRTHRGASPTEAISGSVRFLALPLAGSTFTTILAFLPMVLAPGPMGEFIGSIAISVTLALIGSFLLAMTVVPALTAILGAGRPQEGPQRAGPLRRFLGRGIALPFLLPAYRGLLRVCIRHPLLALAVALPLPFLGFAMAGTLPEQFFPPADRDQFRVELVLPSGTPLERTRAIAEKARVILAAEEDVAHVHWFVGRDAPKFYYNMLGGGEGTPYYAEAMVDCDGTPAGDALLNHVQTILDRELPEAQFIVRKLEQGPPFDAPVELRLVGSDLDALHERGEVARRILASLPHVTHVQASLDVGRPQLFLDVDEERMRSTGLQHVDLASQLLASFEGVPGGALIEETESLPIRVRRTADARRSAEDLRTFEFVTPGMGEGRPLVPLSAIATPSLRPERASISRRAGERVNTISGYLEAGVLPSTVLLAYRAALEDAEFTMPAGMRLEFGGEQAERDEAVGKLLASVAVLLVLMLTSLVVAFSSFRLTGLIGIVAVLSIGLGLASLFLFRETFGFMAIVGIMGLVGIAINDAIAVIAALHSDEATARGDVDGTVEVVIRSTRHILATTVTTVAGFLPLLLGGEAFWRPLGLAISGGVVGATIIALILVPSLYRFLYMRRARRLQAASS